MRRDCLRVLAFFVLVVLLPAVLTPASSNGDQPPKPPSGELRLASGQVVHYTIHFDRNPIRDSLRVGNSLIAATTSGALLRFELPEARLVQERIEADEVTCLGRGEAGEVLAGLRQGRVCRVDPVTLQLTEMTKLSAEPTWIG